MGTAPMTTNHSVNETTDESTTVQEEIHDQNNFETMVNTRVFPWIKVVIRIFNRLNLDCDHRQRCSSDCYDKQTNSCVNLIDALSNLYQSSSIRRTNRVMTRKTILSSLFFFFSVFGDFT